MQRLVFENVRCFFNHQSAALRPITLLIGENSTGKSTFLALTRIAWDLCQGAKIDFNEEPFPLGTYDQVASYRGGRAGRAKNFTIGVQLNIVGRRHRRLAEPLPADVTITGCFTRKTQPRLRTWLLETDTFEVRVEFPEGDDKRQMTVTTPSGTDVVPELEFLPRRGMSLDDVASYLRFYGNRAFRDQVAEGRQVTIPEREWQHLSQIAQAATNAIGGRPYAFAPIRTRPQRTYEHLKDFAEPEGSHVPVFLARAFLSEREAWTRLEESLLEFGRTSGLFESVRVRRLGRKESDPFQLEVVVSGPAFNLVDVGYGVSQVLPIVVDSLRAENGTTFLLQQPEVHLHPRAQAELASFLALLAKQQQKRFLIETHSDYIVDRIRMDVRDREHLSSKDVSLLYFQRGEGGIQVQQLNIDEQGNIVEPPRGYREFFLNEERRLLLGA